MIEGSGRLGDRSADACSAYALQRMVDGTRHVRIGGGSTVGAGKGEGEAPRQARRRSRI